MANRTNHEEDNNNSNRRTSLYTLGSTTSRKLNGAKGCYHTSKSAQDDE